MPRSVHLCVTCIVALLLLLQTAACALFQNREHSGNVSGSGQKLFSPLNQNGAFLLGKQEAESLALKMNLAAPGMAGRQDLVFAVGNSLKYALSRQASSTALSLPGLRLSYGQLAAGLQQLQRILPQLERNPGLLAEKFLWYRIGPDFGFTGYYEPTLLAARKQSAAYPYPLYRLPPDLRKDTAYHSRHAIDRQSVLAGRNLEIAWVSSETDAFFLHIQGSGRLLFADGSRSHVLYAGKNNRPYVSLGKIMRERGLLEADKVNMQSIRRYLRENPDSCAELFDANPSYVFFREAAYGPVGAMGSPLTPWVSTATDRGALPHGSLTFVTVPLPDAQGRAELPFYGLTLPQDAGGAIKGQRIDLFCGADEQAAHTAGYLNARGAVYVLVKK